ncbi:helix-turn-helix domain-containing protein [Ammoniphilus sp. YIM 78166]|uniref:helix-turn-helix domain-containing protein n=1 Tax=Ammoniphilus sp. YIM 78166 TaxID=1644106 RepID=UPI001F1128FB|nr:helix-turn-helix domain-containing protein [Ammoniphilus sp. YIM 78166]
MSSKREALIERIETHLRRTARHLVKFDTLEETLNYLLDSFWMEFTCDFVAIILKDNQVLIPKAWKGGTKQFETAFPMRLDRCSSNLGETGWDTERIEADNPCEFHKLMKREKLTTWFAVPVKDDEESLGFCVIGFQQFVPMITETERIFLEFGKDVAVAIRLAQDKEVGQKKMKGIKWFNENIFPGTPIEQLVEKIVEQASGGTRAQFSCIYLYDEVANEFYFQPPSVGWMKRPERIKVKKNKELKDYFPYLEAAGQDQLSVPLVVNLRTIGVLHVAEKQEGSFTEEDLELLDFLSTHASALLENARLYQAEIDLKQRLQTFMGHQQRLVKQTVEGENLDVITQTISTLFSRPVILFDRFLRPISSLGEGKGVGAFQEIISGIQEQKEQIKKGELWLECLDQNNPDIGIWPVIGSGDLLGYLTIVIRKEDVDDVLRLTIEHALNVYAIQFIKQKLVMDTREQVKDGFIGKLFEEKIEDQDKIIEYANLFNWNLFQPHRIGVLTIQLAEQENHSDLLDREAQKSWVWEQMKDQLSLAEKDIMLSKKGDEFILIVPSVKEQDDVHSFWEKLYLRLNKLAAMENPKSRVSLGVGGKAERITDYYYCYKQAVQAHNVVSLRFREKGFALFEESGAYTLLNNLKDPSVATLFINKYLTPLLNYTEGKGADLFNTLRMYLDKNGNLKDTMDALYIHRSTLRYRIERIREVLELDLENAENRLNLMIAYKLYDLYYTK